MKYLASAFALMFLAACSEPAPPPPAAPKAAAAKAKPAPKLKLKAPSGTYALDPNHSSIRFSVMHLGLAPYVMEFTGKQAVLELDADDMAKSKVSLTANASSLRTNYMGDYKATHKDTPYSSFDEALIKDAKFLNVAEHPEITFKSTSVKVQSKKKLQVIGDLTMLGQTHPLTLDVRLTGSMAQHPWTKQGAVGFSATGEFKRSKFGLNAMLQPPLISDAVSITFNGEFHQQVSEATEEAAEEAAEDMDEEASGEEAADEGASSEPTESDYE